MRRLLIFLFIVMAALGFAGPCAALALRADVEVNRPTVKLSDVFEGLPPGVDCDIARAPAPGKSITYDVNVLALLARKYQLDWQPESLSDHATITTAGTKITADDIRKAVLDKIRTYDIKGDIDVMFDNHALEVVLPSDRAPDFTLSNFDFDAINKRFHADLVADGFAGPISLPVTGHLTVRRQVPVLARRMEAGTLVGDADIDWISVAEDRTAGAIVNADQLIGHELREDTDAGLPVPVRDAMPPRLVVRGTLVTMKIETPLMVVTAQGRALQDGKRGDTVRVVNTQSNRMIEGVVESTGVVRVAMSQRLAQAVGDEKRE